ncbi:bifunctional UDP-N-acetylglucosamine diphosphorylase/glucosamine-1-phosphate N-acetyltransferase GlmU [Bermanella marisrubri]|uniref:Bifunctional protein GlmU n=1 Tax=Bermanella marisrubri TaxID=207949 RepID=Q1MZ62_9GAMM|nr:bifunctional UDP-N-acetylglucosamine diphosphorylase/glucosamine-1-phosphate N-acetyltransferase GlmU [Bermanella marisrubri]EAT11271.1 glucosamine-1-phosphate acetyltransferase/N-acetylglucosamine-1-phosphate [Oceanobacter sp. RED65] [Bermanella marisrubri]QIZ82753.1 bifunctional UDP-N-acetylglucosamine diphosphorylase/glucosamine-1-phosphate N-acetyltransferase GlmU [Bermanella marisrubri]
MSIEVVVLAAGQGSRMKSQLPKVLHPIAGKPMLAHVLDSAREVNAEALHVVVGHGAEQVQSYFGDEADLTWALQKEQNGTGHAVMMALEHLAESGVTLILYGDVPLIQSNTLQALIDIAAKEQLGLLTVNMDDPTGYGRIVRNEEGSVQAIVEHKDASEQQKAIQECNTGILAVPTAKLHEWLPKLSNDNAQGEYYLTDIIEMSVNDGMPVETLQPEFAEETFGVNNRLQQAELERWYQGRLVDGLMTDGVTVLDPQRLDIRPGHTKGVTVGRDVVIDVNVVLEGEVVLGDGVYIESHCVIRNAVIAPGTHVKAFSHIEDALVKEGCEIGPYARLRPGAQLENGAKVGNFCEVKKSIIGEGSKVNHLTYIGDAEIGQGANIGAGTITCNYDGVNKFKTVIGDGAFIGSNSSLVAPVTIGKGATIGAGSTITKDVEDDKLAVGRGRQKNLDWQRPTKK